jgi:hypothetical protein
MQMMMSSSESGRDMKSFALFLTRALPVPSKSSDSTGSESNIAHAVSRLPSTDESLKTSQRFPLFRVCFNVNAVFGDLFYCPLSDNNLKLWRARMERDGSEMRVKKSENNKK